MQTRIPSFLLVPTLFAGCLGAEGTDDSGEADADADTDADTDIDTDTGSDTTPARPDTDPAAPFALMELFTSEG